MHPEDNDLAGRNAMALADVSNEPRAARVSGKPADGERATAEGRIDATAEQRRDIADGRCVE
jgi:hypothetical protein